MMDDGQIEMAIVHHPSCVCGIIPSVPYVSPMERGFSVSAAFNLAASETPTRGFAKQRSSAWHRKGKQLAWSRQNRETAATSELRNRVSTPGGPPKAHLRNKGLHYRRAVHHRLLP